MSQGMRRLAAIMYTDMVGFTALGQRNEALSLAIVEEQRKLIRPILTKHFGREVKTIGDAFLVEFQSALEAVRCAYDIQRATREFNFTLSEDRRVHLRVGIHLGDVVESQGDIAGDAVNVASRIQALASDGGVCLTRQVYDHVQNKFELPLQNLGPKSLKNVSSAVEVYRMVMPWEEVKTPSSIPLNKKRIAVLPFANISPDPSDEYFADGLTDELIDRLAQIKEIEVIARTSIMTYKKSEKKAAEIGRELRAGLLLEGGVRKAGNKVRVTAQIIDANTEAHLWSSRYDKNLEDIFAIQSDIAEQVAQSLALQLLPHEKREIEKKTAENATAYLLCMKARYYWNERTREDNETARKYYEEAIKLDPSCALAYSGVSDCYHIAGDYGWLRPDEAYPRTAQYATKALEFNPDLAEGHASLGATYMHYEWKWREAEAEIAKAISLRPSYSTAHQAYSTLLLNLGRFDESYERIRKAYELDPLSKGIEAQYGQILSAAGRNDEAITHLEKMVRDYPDFPAARKDLGFAYYRASRTGEAIRELTKAVALSSDAPSFRADLAFLLSLAGRSEEARQVLSDLKRVATRKYVSSVKMACILYGLGDTSEAFEFLERAYVQRDAELAEMRSIPETDKLRTDARWVSLETRMGFRNA